MKTFILKISAFVCVGLLLVTALCTTSCKKDKTCRGKVTVVDTAGARVANAAVKLSSPPSVPPDPNHPAGGDLVINGVTDGSGVVNFEIQLPTILDIVATQATAFPGMTGKGILRLDEPGKTAEVTVKIKP